MPSSFQRIDYKNSFKENDHQKVIAKSFANSGAKPRAKPRVVSSSNGIKELQQDSKGLNTAFKEFSKLSAEILNSYSDLEDRVEFLNEELRVVSNKRLQDFEQKNALASRLQSLLSILPSGVVLLDGKGLVSQANPVAENLLGKDILSKKWSDIVKNTFVATSGKAHESVLTDGRRLHVATCPLEFEAGQLIVLTDISNMHRLQSRVDRNRRLAVVGKAMSSLSHQLRTPLATALLYVSHLQSNAFDEKQKKDMARKLQGRLQQMNSQIDDMLLFARGGQEQANRFSINEWIETNREQIEDLFKLSNVDGTIEINTTDDCDIYLNEHAFGEALFSLIVNACEAVTDEPIKQVTLKIQNIHNHLLIQVKDSGAGIPDSVSEDLFDPFISSKTNGTGLGLAIVQAVINSARGQVNWRNQQNSGAEFSILLPLVQDLHNELESELNNHLESKTEKNNSSKQNNSAEKTLQNAEGTTI